MTLVWRPGFSGLTDADAIAYVAAVEAADGQALEFGVGKAINDFIVGCKLDGTWNAIKASCILAGARTLNGALVPLVGTAPTNVGPFVSGDYNRKTGLKGDGSTKYLNSNRNNNTDPQNNKHLSVHMTQLPSAGSAKSLLGTAYNAVGWSTLTWDDRATKGTQAWINGFNYPTGMVALATVGFVGASRSTATSVLARVNNTSPTSNVTSQTPAASNLMVFGSATDNTDARLAFYSIGESLDLAKLDTRVSALITAIGAAIP